MREETRVYTLDTQGVYFIHTCAVTGAARLHNRAGCVARARQVFADNDTLFRLAPLAYNRAAAGMSPTPAHHFPGCRFSIFIPHRGRRH